MKWTPTVSPFATIKTHITLKSYTHAMNAMPSSTEEEKKMSNNRKVDETKTVKQLIVSAYIVTILKTKNNKFFVAATNCVKQSNHEFLLSLRDIHTKKCLSLFYLNRVSVLKDTIQSVLAQFSPFAIHHFHSPTSTQN